MLFLLTLLACGPGDSPWAGPDLVLLAEPTLRAEGEITLENRWRRKDLIVADILLLPDEAPARRMLPDAEWTLEPGDTRTVGVRFDPLEVGTWEARMLFVTDVGDVEASITLVSEVVGDGDGDGWSVAMGDCDDDDETAWPGAPEQCDGVDDDCDGEADEDFDADHDDHLDEDLCPGLGDDCNDADRTAYPGRDEECDQTDSDCNGLVDDIDDLADKQEGVCEGTLKDCTISGPREPNYGLLEGYQLWELACDGLDNDCDGDIDGFDWSGDGTSDCVDDDGDGETEIEGDCDDTDPEITSEDCGPSRLAVTTMASNYGLRVQRLDLGWWEWDEVDPDVSGEDFQRTGSVYQVAWAGSGDVLFTNGWGWFVVRTDLSSYEVLEDGVSFEPEAWWTYGVLVDPDTEVAWVGVGDAGLLQLDPTDLTDTTAMVLHDFASATQLTRHGDHLWGCGLDGGGWRFDTLTGDADLVDLGFECTSPPVVDEVGGRVLFSDYQEEYSSGVYVGQIAQVDLETVELLDITLVDWFAYRMHLASDGLWVTAGVDNGLLRYDPDTFELQVSLSFAGSVRDVWVDEERGSLWASVFGSDVVYELDWTDPEFSVLSTYDIEQPDFLQPLP